MAAVLRNDFARAGVGLTLPAQKKNLALLHDWLVEEQQMPDHELVVALTNYQQGRFGRMPTHILLVTSRRIAYTQDGSLQQLPIEDIDTSRIGLHAGIINGEITLALRSGETLTFRRGMSAGMQEIAAALRSSGR